MFSKKSFTLIEILIVGAIVSIIAGVATLNVTKNISKGKDTERLADLREIQTALESYKISFNKYPEPGTQGSDNYIIDLAADFIKELPKDPSGVHNGSSGYIYSATADRKNYCFYIKDTVLEPKSQSELIEPALANTWKICSGSNLFTGSCSNGASNYPSCNLCAPGYSYANSSCVAASCQNGATNPPNCNICSSGYAIQEGEVCSNTGNIIFILVPQIILLGQSSQMFWFADNNSTCKINNQSVPSTGIENIYPATTTSYKIECTKPNSPIFKKIVNLQVSDQTTCQNGATNSPLCDICPAGYEIQSNGICGDLIFKFVSGFTDLNQSRLLNWSVNPSYSCKLNGEDVPYSGVRIVNSSISQSYTIECITSNKPTQTKTLNLNSN